MKRVLLATLLLSACTSAERLRWVINTSNPQAPVAIYGPERPTEGDAGLSCAASRNMLELFLVSDAPLTDGRPISLKANGKEIRVRERFDSDGLGVSYFEIPRTAPITREIAGTAKHLSFALPAGEIRLPLGAPARQIARQCLVSTNVR